MITDKQFDNLKWNPISMDMLKNVHIDDVERIGFGISDEEEGEFYEGLLLYCTDKKGKQIVFDINILENTNTVYVTYAYVDDSDGDK